MKIRTAMIGSLLPVLWFAPLLQGSYAPLFFRDLVRSSDVIVEGTVVEQTDINTDAKWNREVYRKASVFTVTRACKGNIRNGQSLKVFSHLSSVSDTCRPEKGIRYLLMLKSSGDGYIDTNRGQGTYEIVDLGENRQAVAGTTSLGPDIPLLEQFRSDLAWAMEGPKGPTSRPAVAEPAAQTIAENTLFEAGMDVSEYQAARPELLTADHDVTGVAYKDDPVWFFNWELSAAGSGQCRTEGYVYCYVNAQTGKAFWGPNRPKTRLSAQDLCRVFLRMYGPCRQAYAKAGPAAVRLLTETEFLKLAPRVKSLFLSPKSNYPEGTCFLMAEFPPAGKARPIVVVLDGERKIDFAGVVQEEGAK
jgi:hypothetical protein